MKVTVERRLNKAGDKQSVRLVYWLGSSTDSNGKVKHNRKLEQLDVFLYATPKTLSEKRHNKDVLALVEAIRAKRITEAATSKHGFVDQADRAMRFYALFDEMANARGRAQSKTSVNIWRGCRLKIKDFWPDELMTLASITPDRLLALRTYLEQDAVTKTGQRISNKTAVSYFTKVRAVMKRAYDRGYIRANVLADVPVISVADSERVYLSIDEVRRLVDTQCRYEVLKRAFLFACLTGLRWSDVFALEWSAVSVLDGVTRLTFQQRKTGKLQYLDITPQAVQLLGAAGTGRVFLGLRYSTNSNIELVRWALAAGISKHITFHAARHTFAVAMLSNGVDIYTVSKLLGHTQIKTTQIYADIIDEVRKDAMHKIPDIGL